MKKHNATVKITSVINSDENEKSEFVTDGAFYLKNGSYYILYEEKEEMGMADGTVTVKVSEDGVSVTRKGGFSSRMNYRTGTSYETLYNTPYGSFPIMISTREINENLNITGGRIEILYSVTISREENFHSLAIEVKAD